METDGSAARWATFDCYGTLVDWNRGVGDELERLFGAGARGRLLATYHELEPAIQSDTPTARYRDVLAETLRRIAAAEGLDLPEAEHDALGRSLPGWHVFQEVPGALEELRSRGWNLVILSNTDREFIEASMGSIGVPFERAIVASEIGSYKPAHGHWQAFIEQTGADPSRHVHVAASLFHDVAPTAELGIPCVWVNRLGEDGGSSAAAQLPDLSGLPEALDGLVSA